MNLVDLTTLINNGELDKLRSTLEISKYTYFVADSFGINNDHFTPGIKQGYAQVRDYREYEPRQHDVFDQNIRQKKKISDDNGNLTDLIDVNRIALPEQKSIVLIASSFLGVPTLDSNPQAGLETDFLGVINAIQEDNKADYKFKDVVTHTLSERECAKLWFTQDALPEDWEGTAMVSNYKFGMRVLAPSLGDTLYPCFDNFGDMVAFGRYYVTVLINPNGVNERTQHFDIYTADKFYFLEKLDADPWQSMANMADVYVEGEAVKSLGIPNVLGKIPVIYYWKPATEWHDVQPMISRLETIMSNLADTNDYNGSPIIKAKGKVAGFSGKGETGKVLEMTVDADVSYLTWDNAPASIKMEIDYLISGINKLTHTPNISFDNIKGLGKLSGQALKFFFMDAHIKAADNEKIFGMGEQRSINFLKSAIITLCPKFKDARRLMVKPKFTYFLPRDYNEEVTMLVNAVGAGILSIETAVKLNPLVTDWVNELEKIKTEAKAKPVPPVIMPPVVPPLPPIEPVVPPVA